MQFLILSIARCSVRQAHNPEPLKFDFSSTKLIVQEVTQDAPK